MASKTTNFCSCYYLYPNPNHKYCLDFIRIKKPNNINHAGYCIRKSAFPKCMKCLNLDGCKTVWKLAQHKNLKVFACTDYEE